MSYFSLIFLCSFTLFAQSKDDTPRFRIPELSQSHLVLGESAEQRFRSKHVKVLVWNILKTRRENWSADFSQLAKGADLILLQEAYLNTLMREVFMSLLDYRMDFGISFLYENKGQIPTGTALVSRVNPILSAIIRTIDLEPYIKTPKTITYSYYPIHDSSQTMLVMNIHGMNVTKQIVFERQIIEAFKVIETHSGPVIFGGDFNTRSKDRMEFLRKLAKANELKEVAFENDDERMTVMGNPLDHVFIRNFQVKEARVLPEIETSDHKPLYLDLILDLK